MENLEWFPFFYKGIETNIECTKCGKIRRIKKDWYGYSVKCTNVKYGQVDFTKLKPKFGGYLQVGIQIKNLGKRQYQVHEIIANTFLIKTYLKNIVHHKDGNPSSNNISNLCFVSHRENMSKERTLKSGLPVGVMKKSNKYCAQIKVNYKNIHLGYFETIEEASNAYQNKLKSLN